MQSYVLIGFLLACTVAGLPLRDDDSGEYASIYKDGIFVEDDNGNLIKVRMDEDDAETEEETRKDLRNRAFFYLHTRKTPLHGQQLYIDDEVSLKNSYFDPKKPTKFVTHGWVNSAKSPACTLIRDAFIKQGDYNVIVLDWSSISYRPYIWASKRVLMVGQFVSAMIDFLEKHGMDLSKVTLVGHSLGAHVMGLAARNARGTPQYVVGLDPALPNFVTAGPGSRIASGDAKYVEIIHTNAGLLGYHTAIGDTDFYPNGGSRQYGCLLDIGGACSHARSFRFFAESIYSPVGFRAKNCETYRQFRRGECNTRSALNMGGLKQDLTGRGTFYLQTNRSYPYAISKRK